MRSNLRCPSAQCRVTDDYICKVYRTPGEHLVPPAPGSFVLTAESTDGQLYMGHLWCLAAGICLSDTRIGSADGDANSHLPPCLAGAVEVTRRILHQLPAEPGELFTSAALTALDCTAEADITRWQLAALHSRAPVSQSGSRPFPAGSQGPQLVFPRADQKQEASGWWSSHCAPLALEASGPQDRLPHFLLLKWPVVPEVGAQGRSSAAFSSSSSFTALPAHQTT